MIDLNCWLTINTQKVGVIIVLRSSRPGISDYGFGKRFKRIERKSVITQGQRSEDLDYNANGRFSCKKKPLPHS